MTHRTTLALGLVLAFGALVLAVRPAWADEKTTDKNKSNLQGTWREQGAELKLEFCDKDVLKIMPHGDAAIITVVCSYTIDKDKRVNAKITELTGKAKDKAKDVVPVGLEFSFTWKVKDQVATLGDVKGDKADAVKSHLEGTYEQK